ncbi:MAG: LOG family protein [Verrucomicrobia bacterium]|nr:LOG family protein [Verrucomicrobiota bacterium]
MTKKPKSPVKAYRNLDFLASPDARPIRILAEFLEPASRFRRLRVRDTIVFFGSSRAESMRVVKADARALEQRMHKAIRVTPKLKAERERLDMRLKLARYYEDAVELARRLTVWAREQNEHHRFIVASGGGPGIMEAANLGAARGGGKSIGLNISIPTEQDPNPYISDGYSFEFHYFFMRKLWFVFLARAMVIFPGGFGTMDELMEALTLVQTRKVTKPMTIVLYGSEYWDEVLNLDALVRWGTIAPEDLRLLHRVDDTEEAFNYLKDQLGASL